MLGQARKKNGDSFKELTGYKDAPGVSALLRLAGQSVERPTLVAAPAVLCVYTHHVQLSGRKHYMLGVCGINIQIFVT